MQIVKGASHYLFMHDDVVLDHEATKLLLEGSYMYNCGVAGPKVLDYQAKEEILSVGYLTDRFMVPVSLSEQGEIDQGQYDQIREVIAVDGAAMMIRSDLFVAIGGFDVALTLFSEDIDICVRAKTSGASVYVFPEAKVFHLAALSKQLRFASSQNFKNGFEALRYGEIKTMTSVYSTPRAFLMYVLVFCMSLVEIALSSIFKKNSRASSVMRVLLLSVSSFGLILKQRKSVLTYKTVSDRQLKSLQIKSYGRFKRIIDARSKGRGIKINSKRKTSIGLILFLVLLLIVALRGSLFYGFIFNNHYIVPSPLVLLGRYFHSDQYGKTLLTESPANLVIAALGFVFFNSTSTTLIFIMVFLLYLTFKNLISLFELIVQTSKVKTSERLLILMVLTTSLPFLVYAFNDGDIGFLVISSFVPWAIFTLFNVQKIAFSKIVGVTVLIFLGIGFEFFLPIILVLVSLVCLAVVKIFSLASLSEDTDNLSGLNELKAGSFKRFISLIVVPSAFGILFSAPWSLYVYDDLIHNRLFIPASKQLSLQNLFAGNSIDYLLVALFVLGLIALLFMNGEKLLIVSLGYGLVVLALIFEMVSQKGYGLGLPTDVFYPLIYAGFSLIVLGVGEVIIGELSSMKFSMYHGVVVLIAVTIASMFVINLPQLLSGNSDIPVGIQNDLPSGVVNSKHWVLYVNARKGGFNSNASNISYKISPSVGFTVIDGQNSISDLSGVNNVMSSHVSSVLQEISLGNLDNAGTALVPLNIRWVVVMTPLGYSGVTAGNLIKGLNSQRDLQYYNSGTANIYIFKNLEPLQLIPPKNLQSKTFKMGFVSAVDLTDILLLLLGCIILIAIYQMIRRNYVKIDADTANLDDL